MISISDIEEYITITDAIQRLQIFSTLGNIIYQSTYTRIYDAINDAYRLIQHCIELNRRAIAFMKNLEETQPNSEEIHMYRAFISANQLAMIQLNRVYNEYLSVLILQKAVNL